MYNRLLAHINANNLLYKFQFGFRNKYSPNLAMIYLIDKISNALQNGDLVLGLFLDFSKAFDTVDHDILLDKLEFYGIRGCAHDWFKSYLTNRKQFVEFDSHTSSLLSITCGVPQVGLKGVLVVPVSESIWACNRLQIWPTGTRFLTGEVIPGVAALKSWTK